MFNKLKDKKQSSDSDSEKLNPSKNISKKSSVLLLGLVAGACVAASPFISWPDVPLTTKEVFSQSSDPDMSQFGPVNSPIDFKRFNNVPNAPGAGDTHSVLSVQSVNDVEGQTSFAWPLLVKLTTNHASGDGDGVTVQLHHGGSGTASWATGYHVDGYHEGLGTTIGSNIEMINGVAGSSGDTIGLNVQSKAYQATDGLRIQTAPLAGAPEYTGGWWNGIRLMGDAASGNGWFDTGINLDAATKGRRGIWLQGQFETGIDLGNNNIRMNGGTKINLEQTSQIALKYNPSLNRIEFMNGTTVVAYLNVNQANINLAN